MEVGDVCGTRRCGSPSSFTERKDVLKMFGINPYSPYGYPNPQPSQHGAFNFSPAPQMQQSQPQTQQNASPIVLYVPSVSHVKEVDMRGMNKALVIVQNEPVIAMKEANGMGLTNTEYYRITRYDPESTPIAQKDNDYITRSEFESFVASLNKQNQMVQKPKEEQNEPAYSIDRI